MKTHFGGHAMNKAAISLVAMITLFSATAVHADPLLQKGTRDLSVFGSPDFTAPTGDTLNFDIGFGLFVRDNINLRATLSHAVQEDIAPGGTDYRATGYNLVTEYHFDLGWKTVPYLGADLGWRRLKFGSLREEGFTYGPRLGIKYFLSDSLAIDVALTYKFSGSDVFISDYESEDHKISLGFGLRFMF